jgi:hypothetical protein
MLSDTSIPTVAQRRFMSSLPAFLTEGEKLRLAKFHEGRLLFRGKWRKYLLDEGRTAHIFKALQDASGKEAALLVTVNVIGLAAKKCADMMFLNPPGIAAPDAEKLPDQQEAVDRINQDSHSEAVFYEAALSGTYEGESWIQVQRWRNKVIFANVDASQCFPIGQQNPDGTYDKVEKRWLLSRGAGSLTETVLRKEIHTAGKIVNELWRLDKYGKIDSQADLSAWYGDRNVNPSGEIPQPEIETGVDEPLLQFVPNFSIGGECIGDLDGVQEIVDEFTASISQFARVVAIHSDPKMEMDEETGRALAEQNEPGATDAYASNETSGRRGVSAAGMEVLFTKEGLKETKYIVWNAQLDAALKQIDNWLEWLLAVIEMSPALLGLRKGGAAEAWRKLRLEAANTLAKIARKILWWDRFIKDLYRIAHKLENASAFYRYEFAGVNVSWNDGIPLDEHEQTETIAEQRQAGVVDRRTAVEKLHGAQAEEVNERLDEEDKTNRSMTLNLGGHNFPPMEGGDATNNPPPEGGTP